MISRARLKELLRYSRRTGVFIWRVTRGKARAGAVAGCLDHHGYRLISLDGRLYKAHRLAWLYVYGVWPREELDHRFGRPDDNRIRKLREATHVENSRNTKRRGDNTSGRKGVSYHRKARRWRAYIVVRGCQRHLGLFDTRRDASTAYESAATSLFGAFKRAA